MALNTATITAADIADHIAVPFDPRRAKAHTTTNIPDDTIIDSTGSVIRLGSGRTVPLGIDGSLSITVPIPTAGSNPTTWQTTIHVSYPDQQAPNGRGVKSFGPFTITASGTLGSLVEQQSIPPEYLTTVTQALDAKVAEAEAAASLAVDISGIDSTDTAVAAGFQIPGSESGAYLSATIATATEGFATLPKSTIIPIGTSFTEGNYGPGTVKPLGYQARGYFVWAMNFLEQRLRWVRNAGVPGNTTTQMLARLQADVIAHAPGWCLIEVGPNDATTGVTPATTQANITAMHDALTAAGIKVAVTTPTTNVAHTTAQRQAAQAVGAWLRAWAQVTPNVVLADFASVWISPADGAPVTALTDDGTHPSPDGAIALGRVLSTALDPFVPKVSQLPASNIDPRNLLTNGMATGNTSGMATGFGINGAAFGGNLGGTVSIDTAGVLTTSVAHGLAAGEPIVMSNKGTAGGVNAGTVYWVIAVTSNTATLSATKGGSALATTAGTGIVFARAAIHTASKVARTDGIPGEWQRMTVGPDNRAARTMNWPTITLGVAATTGGDTAAVGDTVEALVEWRRTSGAVTVYGPAVQQFLQAKLIAVGGGVEVLWADRVSSEKVWTDWPTGGILRTPPLTIPGGTTALVLQFSAWGTAGIELDFGRAIVRKVT